MNHLFKQASVCLLAIACSLPAASLAVEQSEPTRLSLTQALELTLNKNPELKLYPLYLRQIDGEMQQADISPIPIADIELRQDEATLTFSQSFELGDKRLSRVGYSSAKQQQLQAEFAITRLDVLAETSRRYYQLLALQKQQSLLEIRIGQEKRALKIIKKRAQAGAISQADVSNMALRLARSQNTLEQLQFSINLAKNRLSAMWLASDKTSELNFTQVMGKLSKLPKIPEAKLLAMTITESLEQLPDYRLQLALSRLADSQVQLEQANGSANINLGLGIAHDRNGGGQSLVVTAAMPLSFSNPNRGRINSALAQQQLSLEQVEIKRNELHIELIRIQQNLAKDMRLAQQTKSLLLPLAIELLSDTQKAYRQGRYTVLQWIDAQNQVFNLEQDLINSQVRIFNQVLELERILGQSIVSAQ
jgi:cobalt-zinc-cadmium efflux system outer membrane protein